MIFTIIDSGFSGWEAVAVFLVFSLIFLISIVGHEYAHAYVAYKNGDDTAYLSGRLTLNPIVHIDPIGAILFLFVGYGWAKPVPINPLKFKKYRTGIARVSLAGVTYNLILCFVSAFFYVLFSHVLVGLAFFNNLIINLFYWTMQINALLFVLNLLPIYPLDGFNYMSTLFQSGNKFLEYNVRYGFLVLIVLIASGALSWILTNASFYLYTPFIKLFELIF